MSSEPLYPAQLSERLPRIVLTLTTGRSGTASLARALGCWRDVTARHEPKPTFGSAFRTVQAAPATAREFWLEHKLPRIARTSRKHGALSNRTRPRPVYAETSHLAGKGFLESLLDLGLRPDLIRLERPARDVARSLYALNTIPGRTFRGVKYYLGPGDRDLRLPLERAIDTLHDYQLAYWYALELGARADESAAAGLSLGLRVARFATAELAQVEELLRLGDELELGPLRLGGRLRLARIARRRWNAKRAEKRRTPPSDAELEQLEADLHRSLP